jgi:hypothetical protein
VTAFVVFLPILAAAAIAIVLLALNLRRRAAQLRSLEAENRALLDQAERLALLDRRGETCAPLDALWLCWSRCAAPGDEMLHAAALATEAAKRLFPAELEPDLDEVAQLLGGLVRHRAWQGDAVRGGRHGERVTLLDEEAEMVRMLKPKLDGLRSLLADATRPAGARPRGDG